MGLLVCDPCVLYQGCLRGSLMVMVENDGPSGRGGLKSGNSGAEGESVRETDRKRERISCALAPTTRGEKAVTDCG